MKNVDQSWIAAYETAAKANPGHIWAWTCAGEAYTNTTKLLTHSERQMNGDSKTDPRFLENFYWQSNDAEDHKG